MEKDIDRIAKGMDTDIVIRIDDFGGKRGVTIREFVKSERYTGFTKAGTRIPADKFAIFKAAINSIDEKDLEMTPEEKAAAESAPKVKKAPFKKTKPKEETQDEDMPKGSKSEEEIIDESF